MFIIFNDVDILEGQELLNLNILVWTLYDLICSYHSVYNENYDNTLR